LGADFGRRDFTVLSQAIELGPTHFQVFGQPIYYQPFVLIHELPLLRFGILLANKRQKR
jgi:hypothetical protein